MRRRSLHAWTAGAAAVAILLAADASAQPLVTPVRVGAPDAPISLSVWAQQDYSHLAARPAIADAFHDVFGQWAGTHRDVQLRVSVMPALEQHKAKLLLAAAAGRLPDVASIDSFWMPLFLEAGHVQPLNRYWPEEDRRDFLPFTIETLSDAGGQVYGLWHETDCRVLFYRKDLVPVPPATWEELLAVASRISRERGIAGYLYNAGRWEATVFDNLPMFWAQGGELVGPAGEPVFGLPPHRERMLAVLSFLRDTIETGSTPRSVLASNDYQQLTSAAIAGDMAMFLGGNWQLRDLETNLSADEFARWDVAPIPQAARGTASTGTGGWVWVVFARDPARQRAAAEFIHFVEQAPNAARISAATGHLPVRRSVYKEFPQFNDRWYQRFGEIVLTGRARPAAAIYPAISQQLQLAIGDTVSGAKTPEAALEDAWRAVQSEYARRLSTAQVARGIDPLTWVPGLLAAGAVLLLVAAVGRQRAFVSVWLFPAVVLAAAVLLYPIFELLRLSMTDTGAPAGPYVYTLESFRAMLVDPHARVMLAVTLTFVVSSVALQLGIGLALACVIDAARRRGIAGMMFVRAAVVGAWVVPGVIVGVLWKILLIENRSGIANYTIRLLGGDPLPFLSTGSLALGSIIVANTWRGCAFSMILQYAGLQRIPRELHEAADLEGLRSWQRLRWLLLPQLAPVILLNLILVTIYSLNTFDLIFPLTGGGPARQTEVLSLSMYRSAFFDLQAGKAAAIAVVMLALNLALAWAAARMMIGRSASQAGEAS